VGGRGGERGGGGGRGGGRDGVIDGIMSFTGMWCPNLIDKKKSMRRKPMGGAVGIPWK